MILCSITIVVQPVVQPLSVNQSNADLVRLGYAQVYPFLPTANAWTCCRRNMGELTVWDYEV